MIKTCKYCGETKDISLFDKDKGMSDGYKLKCKKCRAEYRREFWKTHKRIRYNKEHEKEYNKEYRVKHREELSIKNAEWRKNNPELVKIQKMKNSAKRRAAKRGTTISATTIEINELIKNSNNICFWCDKDIPKGQMQLDHVYPLSKGGGHTISNLVISCSVCNGRKNAKDPEVWLEEILKVA